MRTRIFNQTIRVLSVLPRIAGVLAITIGTAFLIAYATHQQWLERSAVNEVVIKSNTALLFIICGLILTISSLAHVRVINTLRWILSILLLIAASWSLMNFWLPTAWNIPNLMEYDYSSRELMDGPPLMAMTSAVGFILFTLSIMLQASHRRKIKYLGVTLAALVLLIALSSMVGYLYGAPTLYLGYAGISAMALVTAILFAIIATGAIWLDNTAGFAALIVEDSATGAYLRGMLPIVLIVPVLVGRVAIQGYETLYSGALAVALTAIGSIVAATLIATLSVTRLRRAEQGINLRERALESITSGILISDQRATDQPIVYVNRAFSKLTGYTSLEALGRNGRFLYENVEDQEDALDQLLDGIENRRSVATELRSQRADGSRFWNRLSLSPITEFDGGVSHYVGVMEDLTDFKSQQQRLLNALEEAESSNELRDTVVRLIGHELRTPLNSARTWLELMQADQSEEMMERGLTVMSQSIESQSRLIDDLVDISRFASAGVRLNKDDCDLEEVVGSAVEQLRPLAEARHRLTFEAESADYSAYVDCVRIQQVVRNLVENSIKYTPGAGEIAVRLSGDTTGYRIEVTDTGKGLMPAELERVFRLFWRSDPNHPGVGLGLFIVTMLVEAHDGEVTVSSPGVDQGSTFTVTLPISGSENR